MQTDDFKWGDASSRDRMKKQQHSKAIFATAYRQGQTRNTIEQLKIINGLSRSTFESTTKTCPRRGGKGNHMDYNEGCES